MILKGEAGLGLVGSKLPEKRLGFEEVYLDELTLAVAPQHPWAGQGDVAVEELYGQPFIMRERGSGTQMAVQEILGSHGLDFGKLTVAAEMPNTEAVRQSIKAGLGIGILSRLAVAAELAYGDLMAVTIRGVESAPAPVPGAPPEPGSAAGYMRRLGSLFTWAGGREQCYSLF